MEPGWADPERSPSTRRWFCRVDPSLVPPAVLSERLSTLLLTHSRASSAKPWEAKNSSSSPLIGGGTAGFIEQESVGLWLAATCCH